MQADANHSAASTAKTNESAGRFVLLSMLRSAPRVMFPALVYVYRRLAMREEREVHARFGAQWEVWAAGLPRFVPSSRRHHGERSLSATAR